MSVTNSGIYAIENLLTGSIYIGSAVNLYNRLRNHRNRLIANNHKNIYIQRAWNKYGIDAFLFHVLLYCDEVNVILFEQRAIDTFAHIRGRDALYNLCLIAGSHLGLKHREETKAKIGAANRGNKGALGRKHTDESRAAISQRMKGNTFCRGKKLSEDTKAKISLTLMGHTHSEETRAKISKASKGRKPTEEARANMRASNARHFFGKHHTEESKRKVSESKKGQVPWIKGRKHTEETKAKMRAAKQKARHKRNCQGWQEAEEVPAWGKLDKILSEVKNGNIT